MRAQLALAPAWVIGVVAGVLFGVGMTISYGLMFGEWPLNIVVEAGSGSEP